MACPANSLRLKAFAKINLSLRVLSLRSDGFHSIESVMQSISLHDTLILKPAATGIKLECSDPNLPTDKHNLACRAAEAFLALPEVSAMISGCQIFIDKKIPVAAGLAGGSADAAAVIYGLNQFLPIKKRLPMEQLLSVGLQIGSDVPFCLIGGASKACGRGEVLQAVSPLVNKQIILVCPGIPVSTKWAYNAFDLEPSKHKFQTDNDLEPVVAQKYPEILKIKERLLQLGCEKAQMSGSGSSVFGLMHDRMLADEIVKKLKPEYAQVYLVSAVEKGVQIINDGLTRQKRHLAEKTASGI